MSFGFGVGDFIAVTKIIYQVVSCVHEATGSTPQYQALARAFNNLLPTLDTVSRLNAETGDQFLRAELQKAVENAVNHVKTYETRLEKYATALSEAPTTSGKPRRLYHQIRWKLEIEKTIGPFLDTLTAYNDVINIQLNAAGITTLYAVQSDLATHGETLNRSLLSVQDIFRAYEEAQTERWQEMLGDFRNLFEIAQEKNQEKNQELNRELATIREQISTMYAQSEVARGVANSDELFSPDELHLLIHNPQIATNLLCVAAREHPGIIPTVRSRLQEYQMILPGRSDSFVTSHLVRLTTYVFTGVRSTLKFRMFSSPNAIARAPSKTTFTQISFAEPGEMVVGDFFTARYINGNMTQLVYQTLIDFLPRKMHVNLLVPWGTLNEWAGGETRYQVRRKLRHADEHNQLIIYVSKNLIKLSKSKKDQDLDKFMDEIVHKFKGSDDDESSYEDEEEDLVTSRDKLREVMLRGFEIFSAEMVRKKRESLKRRAPKLKESDNTLQLKWAIWVAIEQHLRRHHYFSHGDLLRLGLQLALRKAEAMHRPGIYRALILSQANLPEIIRAVEWDQKFRVFHVPILRLVVPEDQESPRQEETSTTENLPEYSVRYRPVDLFLFAESDPTRYHSVPMDGSEGQNFLCHTFLLPLCLRLILILIIISIFFNKVFGKKERKRVWYSSEYYI